MALKVKSQISLESPREVSDLPHQSYAQSWSQLFVDTADKPFLPASSRKATLPLWENNFTEPSHVRRQQSAARFGAQYIPATR